MSPESRFIILNFTNTRTDATFAGRCVKNRKKKSVDTRGLRGQTNTQKNYFGNIDATYILIHSWSFFRYKIICHPFYHANGTIQKLRFQLAPLTPEPDESTDCTLYEEPMGTFELIMTNGTKYQTVFNRLYSSTGKKLSSAPLSIKSARFIYFDVTDIVDEISVYLHTRIIWQKYN